MACQFVVENVKSQVSVMVKAAECSWQICTDRQMVVYYVGTAFHYKQEAKLSLGQPTLLVVSDLKGHPRSIFMSLESEHATFYQ